VEAAGICGSDLHGYRDPDRIRSEQPNMAGHELAGTVAALGPDVTGLAVGQRVAVEPRHLVGCGHCRHCRRGDYHLCPNLGQVNGRRVHSTGFAQFSLESARKLYPLPETISAPEASLLDVYACAVHALHRAPVNPTHTVVVVGSGPIGLTAAELFRIGGAGRVIVCGRAEHTLEFAHRLGADAVVNSAKEDPVKAVLALTGGEGADVVVEAVGGRGSAFREAVEMAGRGARLVIMGSYAEPQAVDARQAMNKEMTIAWSWSYALWEGVPEFQIALDLLVAGRLRAREYVRHTFPLDRIGEGFATADAKHTSGAIKVVITP
jgi:threonine dehydrogenase-like Zn-dependent dehydrogenase